MTKFSGTFTGQTDPDGKTAPIIIGAVVVACVLVYAALRSAAATIGNLLGDALIAGGTLAVAAVVLVIYVKTRRPRQSASAGRPAAAALWRVRADALPVREARAIAPAPVVNVNIGADFLAGLAGLMNAAQQQPHAAPVIVQAEQQELPR